MKLTYKNNFVHIQTSLPSCILLKLEYIDKDCNTLWKV